MKRLALLIVVVLVCGCGRKWEQFWGQDTRPRIQYIQLSPSRIEIPVGTADPIEGIYPALSDAKYLSVWACEDTGYCVGIPSAEDDLESIVVFTREELWYVAVYNVQTTYPGATKIVIEYVI